MKKRILVLMTVVLGFVYSPTFAQTKATSKTVAKEVKASKGLIGRKAVLTYPQYTIEVDYLSETALHWKITNLPDQPEDTEKVFFNKLSENQYFLSWIEKNGNVVSQIVDTKTNTIKTFLSYVDDKSDRANRSGAFLNGTINFKN